MSKTSEFLDWLISMDDVENADGLRARQTVTLTKIIERARSAKSALPDETDGYYEAARDHDGNIRLRSGQGLLVAHPDNTWDDIKGWLDRADPGSHWARQYQAALTLLETEAGPDATVTPRKNSYTSKVEGVLSGRVLNPDESTKVEQRIYRTLYDAGVSFDSASVVPAVREAVLDALGIKEGR